MISFIVIGRNEGVRLTRALEAVHRLAQTDSPGSWECIYVDSASDDDSIERALSFPKVKVLRLKGRCNAAMGRNAGAAESIGDTLFFIDGDMEVQPGFLSLVYEEGKGLKHGFVSGAVADRYYDAEETDYSGGGETAPLRRRPSAFKTGGLFLVSRQLWEEAGGMRNEFRVNEDIDFGIRLAGLGVKPLRRPELLAIHNTVSWSDSDRMWKGLSGGSEAYRAVLLRKNLFNAAAWGFFFRTNYTLLLLVILAAAALVSGNLLWLLPWPAVLILRSILKKEKSPLAFVSRLLYYMAYELLFPFAFLFFHPRRHEEEYEIIRK